MRGGIYAARKGGKISGGGADQSMGGSQFPKEGERGQWEEVSATIVFVAGHNGDGGGGGPGEVMVGGV